MILASTRCAQFQDIFTQTAQASPRVNSAPVVSPSVEAVTAEGEVSSVRDPIETKKGVYYFVANGDTLAKIARQFGINQDDLAQINNLYDSKMDVGRRLFIPQKRLMRNYLSVTHILKETKLAQQRNSGDLEMIWPVKEFHLTSGFGMRRGRPHDGLDLSAKIGTPILAAAEGKIIFEKKFAGYGNLIVIKHAKNFFTAYAHCHKTNVTVGKTVKQGQQIGSVGRTGRASGPHLHFEIHKGVEAVDPVLYLPKKT